MSEQASMTEHWNKCVQASIEATLARVKTVKISGGEYDGGEYVTKAQFMQAIERLCIVYFSLNELVDHGDMLSKERMIDLLKDIKRVIEGGRV